MPFYPDARPRRRLRHHRLLRGRPAARHARRLRRVHAHRARPRDAGDRRPRRQPHLGPAPVVPVGAPQSRARRTATSTSGATTSRPTPAGEVVFPDEEDEHLAVRRRGRASTTCTASTAPARPQHRQRRVRDEIAKIIGFWLELGVSGFRVDAVPFLIEPTVREPTRRRRRPARPPARAAVLPGRRVGDAILLGEVNLPYAEQREFFGGDDGDELTMQFDFIAMQNLYLSLARQDAAPLDARSEARPAIPPDAAVGDLRAQPRRAHARQAHRRASATRSSPPSAPTPTCSSTAAACGAGCRRCSTATPGGCGWSTA